MTRHCLAIPAVTFFVISSLYSTSAQTQPDNPQLPPTSASAPAPKPAAAMSDEDLARLYLIKKQYREAEEIFHRLTLEQPKNAVYWNELGISFHNQAELTSALKCYEKSAKLDSHYADAVNNIGTIWYERKKYPKAIRSYKKAIMLHDDFAPFYLNLGYAYFGEKEYEDSIAAFRKALQIDPESFDPSRTHAGTVIQDRSLSSERGRFYFLLAKSFALAGNTERCVIYLKKAKDEGYSEINTVSSDPSFAAVLKDPAVQELLAPKPVETAHP
jgi:tetratricopeptide (TPR) repeat protein